MWPALDGSRWTGSALVAPPLGPGDWSPGGVTTAVAFTLSTCSVCDACTVRRISRPDVSRSKPFKNTAPLVAGGTRAGRAPAVSDDVKPARRSSSWASCSACCTSSRVPWLSDSMVPLKAAPLTTHVLPGRHLNSWPATTAANCQRAGEPYGSTARRARGLTGIRV